MTAYIITRNRLDNLKKVVPRWQEQGIPVVLVVDPMERDAHESLVRTSFWGDVEVISPQNKDMGVGYQRRFAVRHAKRRRLRSIIMSDDDMRPAVGSHMTDLLREARDPAVLGIGATRPLHDRFSGGVTAANDGLILCPGGWGMQLFALNVDVTLLVGNFDSQLDCFGEDAELMRNGIVGGIPWLVHCGVKCEAIGKRHEPGGIRSLVPDSEREARELRCREIIYGRWPQYVSNPRGRSRVAWQKMMDHFIAGWRERSAMHGGSWR